MQVVVQKNTSQTINQLVILRTADERNRTAGSSSHRPLGFGSRAAFVCHRTAAGEALAISIPGRRHSALPRSSACRRPNAWMMPSRASPSKRLDTIVIPTELDARHPDRWVGDALSAKARRVGGWAQRAIQVFGARHDQLDQRRAQALGSVSNCSHFGPTSKVSVVAPVRLPPGRPRLATSPRSIGSPATKKTTGVVSVAAFAARTEGVVGATITATWR